MLVHLIEKRPDVIDYRVMLMRGYYYTTNLRSLAATREAADKHFREKKLWQERVIATLGAICVETKLNENGIIYYNEAIALHVPPSSSRPTLLRVP